MKKNNPSEPLITIGFLFLIAAMTYLPMIGQLGFYRDDWHVVWSGTSLGWQSIIDLHIIDRPFMGVIYSLTYSLLGNNPLGWHLYIFALRLGTALAFLWLLRLILPRQPRATALTVMLFLVYPGFLEMPTATAYQCHFLGFLSGILSLTFTVLAMRSRQRGKQVAYVLLAVAFGLGCFLIMEYMVGLEGLRLIFIWILLSEQQKINLKQRLLGVLRWWLPGLSALAVFLIWRVFIFTSARSVTNVSTLTQEYLAKPSFMVLRLVMETLKSSIDTVVLAWGVPLYKAITSANYQDLLLSILLASIGIVLLNYYFRWYKKKFPEQEEMVPFDGKTLAWQGALGVLFTLIPVVLSNRQVEFENTFDRYTLPATIGAAMLWMGFIFCFLKPSVQKPVLKALLAIAIITHTNNAAMFRDLWDYQKQLWWQLAWRAPGLKQNTTLIAMLPQGNRLGESYEIWGPSNLIYYPGNPVPQVSGEILNQKTLFELMRQESLGRSVRRIEYIVDYKNSLLMSIPQDGSCLHVIDGSWQELSAFEDPLVRLAAPYSRLSLIETEGTLKTPINTIFGSEPNHDWCYYYQKVSLARQKEDWQEAARLADEVLQMGLKPQDNSEWMPFFIAYARAQRFDDANVIGAWLRDDQDFRQPYCQQFEWMRNSEKRIEYVISNMCPGLE